MSTQGNVITEPSSFSPMSAFDIDVSYLVDPLS